MRKYVLWPKCTETGSQQFFIASIYSSVLSEHSSPSAFFFWVDFNWLKFDAHSRFEFQIRGLEVGGSLNLERKALTVMMINPVFR